jgi:thymidine kinase
MDAIACSVEDLLHIIEDYNVVGIDEVQFYPESVVSVVNTAVADGRKVIVAGLDATFRREPFGFMPQLAAMAEQIDKYNAICHSCGEDAAFTQRLVDGKPAPFSGPTILVDGLDSYEARCRSCYQSVE